MTIQTVVVTNIEKVKAGKTDRVVVHYNGNDGSTWKKGALVVKLDEPSRATLTKYKKQLDETAGSTCSLDIEFLKVGEYWNLTRVGEAGSFNTGGQTSSAPSGGGYKKSYSGGSAAPIAGRLSDVEKGEGQQRGNVLTNATNLVIAAGGVNLKTVASVVYKVAQELYAVSKKLESEIGSTESNHVEEAKQQSAQAGPSYPDADDDISF